MGSAEQAYLFRHAMMRVAAYELQPPLERSKLHAHAYAIIEALPVDDPDLYALELADHARNAALGNPDQRRRTEMLEREAEWLKRAMLRARADSNYRPALKCAERLMDSTVAGAEDRHTGGVMAAEMAAALGDYPRVPEILKRVEEIERDCEDRSLRVNHLLAQISTVWFPRRDYDKCRAALEEAREVSRDIADRLGEARATGFLGNVNSLLGERQQALEHYEAVLHIFRELDHKRGVSTSVGNLGLVYRYFGRLEDAEKAYREALEIDREIGNREGVPRHIGNLGVLYRDLERLDKAVAMLEEADDLFRDLGDRTGTLRNGINLADVYARLGQYQRAVIKFQQAERLARESGLPHLMADCLYYRGEVLLKQGDAVRGEPAMGEAAATFEKLGDPGSAAGAWKYLAESAFERQDYGEALRYAESGLSNLDVGDDKDLEAEYAMSAILAESALAVEQIEKAAEGATRALKLAPETEKDPVRIATLKAIKEKGETRPAN